MKHIITTLAICFVSFQTFAQKTVSATKILKDVKAGIDVQVTNATIDGILDFTYMNEAIAKLPKRKKWWNNGGSNTVEKQITGKLIFKNCIFKDDVLAYIPDETSGYTFIANFEEDVTFTNCTFERKSMFKYSVFEKNADYSNAKFKDDSTFKYAKFERNSSFENVIFKEPSTFKYSKFDRFVSFANAIFSDSAIFKYTEFNNGVSFNNTKFKEDLNIKYTKVRGEFDIQNMDVAYEIDSKYTKINGDSFSKYLIKNK